MSLGIILLTQKLLVTGDIYVSFFQLVSEKDEGRNIADACSDTKEAIVFWDETVQQEKELSGSVH